MRRELEQLLYRYSALKTAIEARGGNGAIPGRLDVKTSRGKHYYYYYPGNATKDVRGQKITNPQQAWVRGLAQQAYEKSVMKLLQKRIAQLENLLKTFQDDEIEQVYQRLSAGRKVLVTPVEMTLETWASQTFPENPNYKDQKVLLTNRGVLVRSKAEKILADLFYELGIVYFYEKPLVLNGVTYYPDFTFFVPSLQKEIYWEHFGLMGNPGYAKRAIQKMQIYAQNGILPGETLITTFEAENAPLNIQWARQLAEHHLLLSA